MGGEWGSSDCTHFWANAVCSDPVTITQNVTLFSMERCILGCLIERISQVSQNLPFDST